MTGKRTGRVLFASDDRGFTQLAVAVHSLLSSADPDRPLKVSVYTGSTPLTEAHREELKNLVRPYAFAGLKIVDVDSRLVACREAFTGRLWHWSLMIWARCLVGEIERDAEGPVVYLDIDTLVCRDLGELYDLDMSDCGDGRPLVLGAVCEEYRESGRGRDPIWDNPLFDARAMRYFNSGFLVMNAAAFREERLFDRVVAWYGEHKREIIRPDQDTLNCMFWDRTRFLHPRYNHCDGWLERQRMEPLAVPLWRGNEPRQVLEAVMEPAVLHFWGAKKPWKWNHRPEGPRYERAMREAGLLRGPLPESTLWRRFVGCLFRVYHAALRRQVVRRLARLSGESGIREGQGR